MDGFLWIVFGLLMGYFFICALPLLWRIAGALVLLFVIGGFFSSLIAALTH